MANFQVPQLPFQDIMRYDLIERCSSQYPRRVLDNGRKTYPLESRQSPDHALESWRKLHLDLHVGMLEIQPMQSYFAIPFLYRVYHDKEIDLLSGHRD